MLSRRQLVRSLAASAAGAAAAWAAGGARPKVAAARGGVSLPTDTSQAGDLLLAPDVAAVPAAELVEEASQAATVSGPPPWELLHPLRQGAVVAHGWRVAELSGVEDGACVLTLRNRRGRRYRVHLCRNDGRPQGLVYTDRFDLVVMNGGQRDLPTEEGLAQAVAEVAHVLAANEGDRRHAAVLTALLPQGERLRRFAGVAGGQLR
jgi:hypothetical protein